MSVLLRAWVLSWVLTEGFCFGEPREVPVESGERKVLFDLLRPEVAKEAGVKEVLFEGSLKKEGKWAFFGGRSLEGEGRSLKIGELENDDTCALWLKTRKGWVLVDWSAGHSDAFFTLWPAVYRLPAGLLGMPEEQINKDILDLRKG
ncbi:MAG: hypothetical protein AAGC74_05995 [Verrucomicrobiota bacterium]